jgi:hypothetical protein
MDVLETRPTRPRPSAVAWAALLVAVVLVVPDLRQDGLDLLEPARAPDRPGTVLLLLDPEPSVVGRTGAAPWDGTLVLHLDEARAVLQVSAAVQAGIVGPTVRHAWGTLSASVPDARCTGRFGWRAASGGGPVDLRCDDGTVRSGQLRTPVGHEAEDAAWSGILDLASVSR